MCFVVRLVKTVIQMIATIRNLLQDFGRNNLSSINSIRQLVRKFAVISDVNDLPQLIGSRVRTRENVEIVRERVVDGEERH